MDTNRFIDAATEAPAGDESAAAGVAAADRYGDVALGVECAWPTVAMAS